MKKFYVLRQIRVFMAQVGVYPYSINEPIGNFLKSGRVWYVLVNVIFFYSCIWTSLKLQILDYKNSLMKVFTGKFEFVPQRFHKLTLIIRYFSA